MRVSVIGGGAWGTALAAHCARTGVPVRLWIREPEVAAAVNERHENVAYLPGVLLPPGLGASSRLAEALEGADTVLMVVPSEFARGIYRELGPLLPEGAVVVSATKGIETDTLRRMSEVAAEEVPVLRARGGARAADGGGRGVHGPRRRGGGPEGDRVADLSRLLE
jgi:glycerol-3-phosphate dehydrogenase (NAD(P)+)